MDLLGGTLTPLEGGYSGETFLAESAGEQVVVRIYGERSAWRGPSAVDVDASLLRLVRGLLPVAEVLEVRRPDPVAGTPGLLVTSRLPGQRLDVVLPTLGGQHRGELGGRLGTILARLSQMPFLRSGMFLDGNLSLGPMPGGASDLGEWLDTRLPDSALAAWPDGDLDGLRQVCADADDLEDRVDRSCLVHSDFNPKNLLVDPESLQVTGLLDWEFAHAGSPYADLGNLLRFDREPAFAEAVLAAYLHLTQPHPADVLDLARAADLWAMVDLAARAGDNPVARRAHDQLLAIARGRDLHARRESGPGSSPAGEPEPG